MFYSFGVKQVKVRTIHDHESPSRGFTPPSPLPFPHSSWAHLQLLQAVRHLKWGASEGVEGLGFKVRVSGLGSRVQVLGSRV